jgi:assimilatory nitrate reductase catalytic subunit
MSTAGSDRAIATHCPYCALQCGMLIAGTRERPEITGNPKFPVNKGGLCVKGWTAGATLAHPARLTAPLLRRGGGLASTDWDDALDGIVGAFRRIQADAGRDAIGVFGGGSLTNEKAYLLGKFARVALGTANIDYNGRFCMSAAAAAMTSALGVDRGLPFPLDDIAHAEVVLLVGANVAETMPPIMQYFAAQQQNGGTLIVVDPRRTQTAAWAGRHLQLRPGTDAALAYGILHILIRDGLIDEEFIRNRTEGFDEVRRIAAAYWPERIERLTGVAEKALLDAARRVGTAKTAMILTARGAEQHTNGVANTLAYVNLALAIGAVGKRFSGFGSLTGQGNGQGGREHGQKTDQLPGYRRIDDPAARAHIAGVWGTTAAALPGPGQSAYEMLSSAGRPGGIRGLLVIGSNPVVSAPNNTEIARRLGDLDFLAVVDFFLSETAQLAHAVLPSAQWAEEDGTATNLEGRVIRRLRAFDPPDGVWTDVQILSTLAARFGEAERFAYATSDDVFDELRRASAGGAADYSGVTYERIDAQDGLFWPCRVNEPHTPRLFGERFPTPNGRARFHGMSHQAAADACDAEFPLHLTTGRVMPHYQSRTQTRHVSALDDLAPEPLAEIHPVTARLANVATGQRICITTRRGTATLTAKVTPSTREDTVFVPFHWGGEASANRLTGDALDPISRMPGFKVSAARIHVKED